MVQGVQFRRGTTAEHSVFTGQSGEITVDTDKNVSVIHDGATVGGHPLVGSSTTQRITNKDINATNINVSGVSTLSGGVQGIGIYSGGNLVTTGIITALNFVGSGNTFAVVGNRIDISIAGGGGGIGTQWVTNSVGISTLSNVGVGTTNPGAKLNVVNDSSSDALRITQLGSGNALIVEDETNPDASAFVVTGIGSVGIGTTNPQTKLSIIGVLGFNGSNVRIGNNSTGLSITSGTNNNFIGAGAGNATNTGLNNNFFGNLAGYSNQNGSSNNFLGGSAGYTNSSGTGNNFFGLNAGFSNSSGSSNNFIGIAAGTSNQTGSNNIYLGARNGISASASYKVIIGSGYLLNYFDSPNTTKDTQFAVGVRTDDNASKYWLVGDENFNVGIGTTIFTGTAEQKLQVGGGAYVSGRLGIGTTNPQETGLTVLGKIVINQDAGSNNRLIFRGVPGTSYRWNIDNYSSANNFRIFREDDATTLNGVTLLTITPTGTVSANTFVGDGSGLTGIVGSGSGVIVRDDNTTIGTAGTINFGANLSVSPISSGIVTVTITNNVSVSGILTANQIYTSNNGTGQNVRIGDDFWLGDVNIANTTRFSGDQDSAKAFVIFGSSDTVALGRTGTGSLYYGGDFTVSGVTTANSFRSRGGAPCGLGVNNNGYGFFSPGDNDSGMYSSADGQIEFYSNSNEAVRINSSQNVGIGTTNPTSKLAVSGDVLVTGIVTASSSNITGNTTAATTRFQSVGEETTRINGNTASLVYNTGGGNIAICTNPTGDITLAVTGIPVDSSFNDTSITFSVFVNQTGTARSCTAVTLNGFNATIRWAGGSLANAITGVTTSNGMDIYSFTGINTVGSASTTANYYLLGVVNGGYR